MTGRPRIGVYGGAFNPPTVAHRLVAQAAAATLDLDTLLIVPTGAPPHKELQSDPGADERLALCRLAFAGVPGAVVDRSEIDAAGPSYTVDTLARVAEQGAPVLIIGADQAAAFSRWHRVQDICAVAQVAVAVRPGTDVAVADAELTALGARHRWFVASNLDCSSTQVRQLLAAGSDPRRVPMLDGVVAERIAAGGLYH